MGPSPPLSLSLSRQSLFPLSAACKAMPSTSFEVADLQAKINTNTMLNLEESIVTVSLVTLAIFCYIWVNSNLKKPATDAPLPPGPRGLPIVGYLPFLGTNLHQTFTQLAYTYGPIYKLWFGSKLCVVINSPSLLKEVVRDQDAAFANRDAPIAALAFTYGGTDIVWSPSGANWRFLRKIMVRGMMSNAVLEACYDLRKDEVLKTVAQVGLKIGSPIDVGETMFMTVFNVLISLSWGGSGSMSEDVKAEFREVVSKVTELMGKPNVSDFFPMFARFDIQGVDREMKRLLLWVEQILDSIIDKRIKGGGGGSGEGERGLENRERKDILQFLLEHNEQDDTSRHITRTQIKGLLLDTVVGGADTTTTMGEWVMAEMMRNPGMMKKAQEEIAQVVGVNNMVEEPHLPKLQYLDAVIKETFRLHPAGPFLFRKWPSVSCKVGGYTVPKGTQVVINICGIHMDPQVWDNPSEFKPERFLDDTSKWDYTGNNFQYIPFGSGRRICAGIPLAERMLKYTLASLLHAFDWQLPKGVELDLSETVGIVLKKRTPLIAIPSLRSL